MTSRGQGTGMIGRGQGIEECREYGRVQQNNGKITGRLSMMGRGEGKEG
jgi:hypothetical protein